MTQAISDITTALLSVDDDFGSKSRTIYLYDVVDGISMKQVIQDIESINASDAEVEQQLVLKYGITPSRKPILLDINTYGGVVYDGLALIACIEQSKTPIITRVNGYAFSMGLTIFLAGHERHMSRHGNLMYHQISSAVWGSLKEQEESLQISAGLQKQLEDYVIERTKWKRKDLKKIYNSKYDFYINAEQALADGFATKII
jgi:ATP-dependent Clp protease protease subunit